ncbi:MAG: ABC transporter substrate-binding protein [Opitutales bacterium]
MELSGLSTGTSILALAGCLAVGCPLDAAEAPLRPVNLQMQWRHSFQYAGYYAAIKQGYYAEAGIELKLHQLPPDGFYWQRVINGEAEFGEMSASLTLLRAEGQPVVLLAPIAQHAGATIAVRADDDIRNVHDLHGKRVMIWDQAILLPAYLKAEGLTSGDYIRVPHNYDPDMLIEGRVDAMAAYPQYDGYFFDQSGTEVRYFQPQASGVDFYGVCLYTTESFLEAEPELVRDFREATLRGYAYALEPENLDEMVALVKERYAPQVEEALLRHEAGVFRGLVQPDYVELGHVNPARWERTLEVIRDLGLVAADASLPERFFYDPNPEPDYERLYRALAVVGAVGLVGAIVGLAFFVQNRLLKRHIRRRHAAEQALRERGAELAGIVREREQALSILSHDLRQPISGVLTYMNLLEDQSFSPSSEEGRQLTREVNRSAHRTMHRLENLLNWIRNRQSVRKARWQADLSVEALVDECEEGLRWLMADRRVRLVRGIPHGLTVRADREHLVIVLGNLLHNAIKYCRSEGQVEIGADSDDAEVWIYVRDEGPGLQTPLDKDGLPEPSGARGGTGLGLALCRELLTEMGSELYFRTPPDGGLEVGFRLKDGQ